MVEDAEQSDEAPLWRKLLRGYRQGIVIALLAALAIFGIFSVLFTFWGGDSLRDAFHISYLLLLLVCAYSGIEACLALLFSWKTPNIVKLGRFLGAATFFGVFFLSSGYVLDLLEPEPEPEPECEVVRSFEVGPFTYSEEVCEDEE